MAPLPAAQPVPTVVVTSPLMTAAGNTGTAGSDLRYFFVNFFINRILLHMLYNEKQYQSSMFRGSELARHCHFVLAALIFTGSGLAWDLHPVSWSNFELAPYLMRPRGAAQARPGSGSDSTGRLVATPGGRGVQVAKLSAADAGSVGHPHGLDRGLDPGPRGARGGLEMRRTWPA